MSSKCEILFDQNEYGTYFTGQVVAGKVVITLSKTKQFKAIKLEIIGYAACQWREKYGRKQPVHGSRKRQKHAYYGREDYIASVTYLVGSEQGPNCPLEAGTHTYSFACPIPLNCPSSFEGAYGHIRYLAKVTFARSGTSNRTHTKGFTVLKLLDLNQDTALLKSPAHNEALGNFCFVQSRAVHLRIDLTQTGFVPGQMVPVACAVNNESRVDCKKVVIMLNLRATYTANAPHMRAVTEKLCLVKQSCGPVPHRSQRSFAETLRVPATAPTCEHLSKVVRISYEICAVAVMNHLMRSPKATVSITIGNVPLMGQNLSVALPPLVADDGRPTTSVASGQPSAPSDRDVNSEEESEEEVELPPPTYEEAMFMATNIADDDVNTVSEATHFTPRYPVYNVALSPPPNPPQKRRKKRRRTQPKEAKADTEKVPVESPVQI